VRVSCYYFFHLLYDIICVCYDIFLLLIIFICFCAHILWYFWGLMLISSFSPLPRSRTHRHRAHRHHRPRPDRSSSFLHRRMELRSAELDMGRSGRSRIEERCHSTLLTPCWPEQAQRWSEPNSAMRGLTSRQEGRVKFPCACRLYHVAKPLPALAHLDLLPPSTSPSNHAHRAQNVLHRERLPASALLSPHPLNPSAPKSALNHSTRTCPLSRQTPPHTLQ
jgi:hypothetical protein